ncbi:MAG: hypothetical protein JNL94_01800 [Planctomycetes bacterium]|nr:hypothetical protein [Planctomycetota bacterium]
MTPPCEFESVIDTLKAAIDEAVAPHSVRSLVDPTRVPTINGALVGVMYPDNPAQYFVPPGFNLPPGPAGGFLIDFPYVGPPAPPQSVDPRSLRFNIWLDLDPGRDVITRWQDLIARLRWFLLYCCVTGNANCCGKHVLVSIGAAPGGPSSYTDDSARAALSGMNSSNAISVIVTNKETTSDGEAVTGAAYPEGVVINVGWGSPGVFGHELGHDADYTPGTSAPNDPDHAEPSSPPNLMQPGGGDIPGALPDEEWCARVCGHSP